MSSTCSECPDLTVVGDVMLGRKVAESMAAMGLDVSAARVKILVGDGLVVGNLECALCGTMPSTPCKADGGPNLRADRTVAPWLKAAGFRVVSLANNHMMDCEADGLLETLDALHEAGVATVGAGRNWAEAIAPTVVTSHRHRIALLAFGNGRAATPTAPGVAPFTSVALSEGMAQVPEDVDATVVMMHAGIEFLEWPESWVRDFAAEALHAGANVVIGGHPHCLRGIRCDKRGLVLYGLGDFIMDTADPQHLAAHVKRTALTRLGFGVEDPGISREGLVVDLRVESGRIIAHRLRPILVGRDFLPALPDDGQASSMQAKIRALSDDLGDRHGAAMRKLRLIEKRCRAEFGPNRTWKDLLILPFRVRPRHLRSLWRRVTGAV